MTDNPPTARVPTTDMHAMVIRIPKTLHAEAVRTAIAEDRTMAQLVRQALRMYLGQNGQQRPPALV